MACTSGFTQAPPHVVIHDPFLRPGAKQLPPGRATLLRRVLHGVEQREAAGTRDAVWHARPRAFALADLFLFCVFVLSVSVQDLTLPVEDEIPGCCCLFSGEHCVVFCFFWDDAFCHTSWPQIQFIFVALLPRSHAHTHTYFLGRAILWCLV